MNILLKANGASYDEQADYVLVELDEPALKQLIEWMDRVTHLATEVPNLYSIERWDHNQGYMQDDDIDELFGEDEEWVQLTTDQLSVLEGSEVGVEAMRMQIQPNEVQWRFYVKHAEQSPQMSTVSLGRRDIEELLAQYEAVSK